LKILFLNRHPFSNSVDSSSLPGVAKSLGHELVDDLEEVPDVVVCIDWTKPASAMLSRAAAVGIPRFLVKLEPSVVIPEYQRAEIAALFTGVMDMGRPFSKPVYPYPQEWDAGFFEYPIRRDRLVAVSANKYSFVPGELYSLRAAAYATLPSLDVYGKGWDRPLWVNLLRLVKEVQIASGGGVPLTYRCVKNIWSKPQNYKGVSEIKLETLSRYKYSLVIENSAEYMSEKLIDSILAGAMPVYVGPEVEALGVPRNLFFPAAPNIQDIERVISEIKLEDWEKWRDSAREWILDPANEKRWGVRTVNINIINEVVASLE